MTAPAALAWPGNRPPASAMDLIAALYGDARDQEWQWQDDAACAGTDPDLFFPERGSISRAARAVCRACPVKAECLEYALGFTAREQFDFGVWGGTSSGQRKEILRRRDEGKAA